MIPANLDMLAAAADLAAAHAADDDRPVPAGSPIAMMTPDLTRAACAEHCACWTFGEMYHRSALVWPGHWEATVHALCALAPADPGDGRDPHDATGTIAAVRVEWDKQSGSVTRSDLNGVMRPAGRGSAAWESCNREARERLRGVYATLAAEGHRAAAAATLTPEERTALAF